MTRLTLRTRIIYITYIYIYKSHINEMQVLMFECKSLRCLSDAFQVHLHEQVHRFSGGVNYANGDLKLHLYWSSSSERPLRLELLGPAWVRSSRG